MAKRRKKDRRTRETAADAEPQAADPLAFRPWDKAVSSPEEGEEREVFERAWGAFRSGDFRQCRSVAAGLAAEATSGEVRRRAASLLDRMRVDPLALGMAAGALALVLMAVVWTFA